MARRDLEVRVRADVGSYQKAMSAAVASTDQLGQAGLRLQKLGLSVSNLGDTLTKNVTLPLVAIGAVATKAALDFDNSFTTMQTLAGVTGDEVEGLKESVLDLAGETGRAPQELAEALYFLQSSGLDSAQAMEALEVSAKASAAGLGDTRSVADAVSSAMLGYAKSGLTAAEATDVLVATAREGKAEPAELASQMGRLIPIASELGITFGDVGGAIAALSTKGFNAEQATTALVNVMGKLLKPSEQAAQLLEEVGLSTDTIRQSLSEKGLLATLEELKAKLGDAGFVKFLEDQQAVQGGLALLGGDLEATKQIFAEVNDSVGATDNAFSTWAESMGAQNARAFAEFQVALIQLGDVIAPIATDIISAISAIARAFGSLPDGVQQAIIYAGLLAAAFGPLLSIGGRVITAVGTLIRLLSSLAVPAGSVAGAFNQSTTAASGMSSSFSRVATAASASVVAIVAVVGTLKAINDAKHAEGIREAAEAFVALGDGSNKALTGLLQSFGGIKAAKDIFAELRDSNVEAAERFIDTAEAAGIAASVIDDMRSSLERKRDADAQGAVDADANAAATEEQAAALSGAAGAAEDAKTALQEYIDTLKAQFDPQFAMIDALQGSTAAQVELRDATAALAEARAGGDVDAIAEAESRYAEATNGARRSVIDLESAATALKDSMAEQGLTADEVTAKFVDLAVQQGFTQQEALVMAEAFGIATGAADTLGGTDPNVAVSETGAAATQDQLHRTTNEALAIPDTVHVGVFAETHQARLDIAGVGAALNDIDHDRTITVTTLFNTVGQAFGFGGGRAVGGPVSGGRLYEVAEQGRAELLEMAGRTYLIPGSDGMVTPAGNWGGAGGMGGGGGGTYAPTFNFTVVANDPEAFATGLNRYVRQNGPGEIKRALGI